VGIRTSVTTDGIAAAVDQAFPELFGWLGQRGIEPAGAPLIRFHVIDMMAELDIEMGVPVAAPPEGDDRVKAGALPAGRYVVLRHVGHYDGLIDSNAELQRWARQQGVALESRENAAGRRLRRALRAVPDQPCRGAGPGEVAGRCRLPGRLTCADAIV
jgi:effector-binding domain-containing protein